MIEGAPPQKKNLVPLLTRNAKAQEQGTEREGREGRSNKPRQQFASLLVINTMVHSRFLIVVTTTAAQQLAKRNHVDTNVHVLMYKEHVCVKVKE